jgi:hypothetical protein
MSFYLMPMIGTGTIADPRRPKYQPAGQWSMSDFGGNCVVWAATADASVAAQADVTTIPPLDNTVAVVATQNALEGLNMPAQWVSAGMTYRTVLRVVVGMAQLVQRVRGLGTPVVLAGNLDRTVNSFSAGVIANIATACDQLGIDRTNITGTTTLREALRIFGQQFAAGNTIVLGDL